MKEYVFITGASAGIGNSCARKFAENKWNLVLTARRFESLVDLKAELENKYSIDVQILKADVRSFEEMKVAIDSLSQNVKENIHILINNAGKALGLDKIQDGDLADWNEMIDTNIKGLLYTTKLIAPLMIARKGGHIINIASVAGRMAYPSGNVYCASKSAVKTLSEGMRIDLLGTGVKVTNIDPGLVETEFSLVRFHGDEERAKKPYSSFEPLRGEDIAEVAYYAASLPDRICLQDILVMPKDQANPYSVNVTKQ